MGCNASKETLIPEVDGDGKEFLERYAVDKILGQGEFGVVKLIHERLEDGSDGPTYAVKVLRKGMQFKDNTLYSAIKPKVLRLECNILRTLRGKHHTLNLVGIYESPSVIYVVTDYCEGGDMFHYVTEIFGGSAQYEHQNNNNHKEAPESANADTGDSGVHLRTEDVSRISYQLFDAVAHMAKHGVIHRDIKPENIMFDSKSKTANLKVIDFGSGTMPTDPDVIAESSPTPLPQQDGTDTILQQFTTFAGSAFYISPEMFQRTYTSKTDVWSAAVAVYVLVAGYPAKDLQEAFNKLQDSKSKTSEERIAKLKELPNMPPMPDTFFEMLEKALTYRHKKRSDAAHLLDCEFIRFHKEHDDDASVDGDQASASYPMNRTGSSVVKGAALRHLQMRQYHNYERSITALIASVLQKKDLRAIIAQIDELIVSDPQHHLELQRNDMDLTKGEGRVVAKAAASGRLSQEQLEIATNKMRLGIVLIRELVDIMKELGYHDVIKIMNDLAHGFDYTDYFYHVALLRQFANLGLEEKKRGEKKDGLDNSMTRKLNKAMASRSNSDRKIMNKTAHSTNSDTDTEEKQETAPPDRNFSSVHGNNVWESIKKQMAAKNQQKKVSSGGMNRVSSTPDLNNSSHF